MLQALISWSSIYKVKLEIAFQVSHETEMQCFGMDRHWELFLFSGSFRTTSYDNYISQNLIIMILESD